MAVGRHGGRHQHRHHRHAHEQGRHGVATLPPARSLTL
jgi:hypothetical protein